MWNSRPAQGLNSQGQGSDVNKATAPKAKAKAKALTLKAKAKALTLKAKAKATHLKAKAKTNSIIGLQDQKCQDQKYIQL